MPRESAQSIRAEEARGRPESEVELVLRATYDLHKNLNLILRDYETDEVFLIVAKYKSHKICHFNWF